VALVADIEKAFLIVSIAPKNCDILLFFWIKDVSKISDLEIQILMFKRVIFFLLKATVRYHLESNSESFPCLSQEDTQSKLLRSMYVDDMVCGFNDEEGAYQLYIESLKSRKFNLSKFITNCTPLREKIDEAEGCFHTERASECKVLGVCWKFVSDQLAFNPTDVYN
jgi:hypothetical protein